MNSRRPPPLNPGAKAWTPGEDAILVARYEREGAAAMARELGRSLPSVHHRTVRLDLRTHRRWTRVDDAQLRDLWGDIGLTKLAKRLNRTPAASYERAKSIGLPLGAAHGLTYLTDAAERLGYTTTSLRIILRWGGVQLRQSMSRPTGSRRHYHVVDLLDAQDAVEAWLATESLGGGAERHKICPETLENWIAASGLVAPPKPGNKQHWRIPSNVIDAAVAARRKLTTIRAAAREAGIPRATLRSRAIARGVLRPAGKLWLIDRSEAAALAAERGRRAA